MRVGCSPTALPAGHAQPPQAVVSPPLPLYVDPPLSPPARQPASQLASQAVSQLSQPARRPATQPPIPTPTIVRRLLPPVVADGGDNVGGGAHLRGRAEGMGRGWEGPFDHLRHQDKLDPAGISSSQPAGISSGQPSAKAPNWPIVHPPCTFLAACIQAYWYLHSTNLPKQTLNQTLDPNPNQRHAPPTLPAFLAASRSAGTSGGAKSGAGMTTPSATRPSYTLLQVGSVGGGLAVNVCGAGAVAAITNPLLFPQRTEHNLAPAKQLHSTPT